MAEQPEISNFDAGVYQWEETDPVLGGVGNIANSPLLSLANRTRWLYNQIVAILAQLPLLAPKNMPVFTGLVTAQGGAVTVGPTTGPSSPYLNFQSSGSATNGYDAQLVASGGSTSVAGQGALTLNATGGFSLTGLLRVPSNQTVAVGTQYGSDKAAFYANLPAGYSNLIVQARVGGSNLFTVDQSGNLTAGADITSGLDITAGRNLVVGNDLTVDAAATIAGGVEIGNQTWNGSGTQPVSYIDLHTGPAQDFDVRLLASAGIPGTIGAGILQVLASSFLAPAPPALDFSDKVATTAFASGTLTLGTVGGQQRGCFEFPNGLMVQWGNDDTSESTTTPGAPGDGDTYDFLKQFPTRCFGVICQEAVATGWTAVGGVNSPSPTVYGISLVNQTGFGVCCAAWNGTKFTFDGGAGFFFIAIGN